MVALVVGGGAVVTLVKHPFAQLRKEIGDVRTEGREAHEKIGTNIERLGDRLGGQLSGLGQQIDGLSQEVAGVRENVARMDGILSQTRRAPGRARLDTLDVRTEAIGKVSSTSWTSLASYA